MLDLACDEGYNTRILARKGAKVTEIAHSQHLIGLARMEKRREPLDIRYTG
jgi:2-polyprenyl-3-methyl-5-hydroxy-6-metoxy-1,4-benzoquinol methylase